jgi:hypothetical protein
MKRLRKSKLSDRLSLGILASLGSIRFLTLNSWGSTDTEWWRAWIDFAGSQSLFVVYRLTISSDFSFADLLSPYTLSESFRTFPNVIVPKFEPNSYSRYLFPIAQPPLFFADLELVRILKEILGIKSDYMVLNLTNILYSLILTIIFKFIFQFLGKKDALKLSLIVIWCNPLLFFNSNINGYRDMLMLICISGSMLALLKGGVGITISGALFGFAMLTKPTAIYALLGFVLILSAKRLLKFMFGILITFIIAFLWLLYTNQFGGFVVAMLTEAGAARRYSESINFWNPALALTSLHKSSIDYLLLHENLLQISNLLMLLLPFFILIFLLLSVLVLIKYRRLGPNYLGSEAVIFFTLFALFIPNWRLNHYVVFLPFFMASFAVRENRALVIKVLTAFFLQDFIAGGFGRNSVYEGSAYYPLFNYVLFFLLIVILKKEFSSFVYKIRYRTS